MTASCIVAMESQSLSLFSWDLMETAKEIYRTLRFFRMESTVSYSIPLIMLLPSATDRSEKETVANGPGTTASSSPLQLRTDLARGEGIRHSISMTTCEPPEGEIRSGASSSNSKNSPLSHSNSSLLVSNVIKDGFNLGSHDIRRLMVRLLRHGETRSLFLLTRIGSSRNAPE